MPNEAKQLKNPGYLLATLSNKCPKCRQGKIFKNGLSLSLKQNMEMNTACPVCGQATEIEVGFYYGTGYVSYALTVALSVASFIAWWVIIGFSLDDNRLFWWMGFNAFLLIACIPVVMRLSRSLWLSWFVKYDPKWQENGPDKLDRVVKNFMEK